MFNTTAPHRADSASAFTVVAHGTLTTFFIDDDAFDRWVAAEGDELECKLPDPSDDYPGSTLAELVYLALSVRVITSDPGIELNIHSHADEDGYVLRLNNVTGRQDSVGLTRGRHELRWPPNDLTPSNKAHHYLHEVCRSANALLNDLLIATD